MLVSKFKEIGEAITILLTELAVCGAFIYFSKKHYNIKLLFPLIFEQLFAGIPYVIIIIFIKFLIVNPYAQISTISLLSMIWFFIFHFVILKNGLVKNHPSLVPAVLILFLNPLKIDPYTKIVVNPYATIIQINNSIIFYCLNLIP